MSESFLIRGAALPAGERADVLLQGGRIAEVRPAAQVAGMESHDLGGGLLAPGFIDLHVHSLFFTDPVHGTVLTDKQDASLPRRRGRSLECAR